jgi:hypothetical protein
MAEFSEPLVLLRAEPFQSRSWLSWTLLNLTCLNFLLLTQTFFCFYFIIPCFGHVLFRGRQRKSSWLNMTLDSYTRHRLTRESIVFTFRNGLTCSQGVLLRRYLHWHRTFREANGGVPSPKGQAARSPLWLCCHLVVTGLLATGTSADSPFAQLLSNWECVVVTEADTCLTAEVVSHNGLSGKKILLVHHKICMWDL